MSKQQVQRVQGVHILLLDDKPDEVESLLTVLQAQGARVTVASEPRKGLQLARVFDPD